VVPNSYFLRHVMDDAMRMRYRYLSYGDSAALSSELQEQPSITKLDVQDNAMGPHGMLCFAEMLKSNAYITEANFANNNVGVFGARLMKFILLKNVRLVRLNMSGNKFGERGATYIAKAINGNNTLRELCVANNGIGDEGANLIGKALATNTALEYLDLSWNHIGRKGAIGLSKGIKANTKLITLKLRMNGCGEEGGRAMIAALRYNDSVRHLDLSANRVGNDTAKALSKAMPYLRLNTLKLAYNPLSSDSAQNLLTGLIALEDPPLVELDLNGVIVEDDFQLLASALGSRQVTIHFHVPPTSSQRSRDSPTETLHNVLEFLEDVEMQPESLFPNPGEGDIIMTVEELFTHMESSSMFRDTTRLLKLKEESYRHWKMKFLMKELFSVAEQRRQTDSDVIGQSDSDVMARTHSVCDGSEVGTDQAGTDRSQVEATIDGTKEERTGVAEAGGGHKYRAQEEEE